MNEIASSHKFHSYLHNVAYKSKTLGYANRMQDFFFHFVCSFISFSEMRKFFSFYFNLVEYFLTQKASTKLSKHIFACSLHAYTDSLSQRLHFVSYVIAMMSSIRNNEQLPNIQELLFFACHCSSDFWILRMLKSEQNNIIKTHQIIQKDYA